MFPKVPFGKETGIVMKALSLAAIACVLLWSSTATTDRAEALDSKTVQRVDIDSEWGGLGTPRHAAISILRQGDDYYESGVKISSDAVAALVDAVTRPTLPKITPAALGITQAWLNAHGDAALALMVTEDSRAKSPDIHQTRLFLSTFENIDSVGKIIEGFYAPNRLGWTDDYPSVTVRLFLSDGQETTVHSTAQQALMLPWLITTGSTTRKTYDPALASAIAGLLPKGTVNADRLSNDALLRAVASNVFDTIWDQWQTLEADRVLGASLNPIRQRYTIESSEIGSTWVDNGTDDLSRRWWDAKLSRPGLPTNVQIDLALEIVNGKMNSAQPFLNNGESYVTLARSIPWLSHYVSSHEACHLEVRFIDTKSLSDIARAEIDVELSAHKREKLAADVDRYANSIALISIVDNEPNSSDNWSVWLALPDKRMILWYFRGSTMLNYHVSEFEVWPMMLKFRGQWTSSDLGDSNHAGAVIAPDGSVAER